MDAKLGFGNNLNDRTAHNGAPLTYVRSRSKSRGSRLESRSSTSKKVPSARHFSLWQLLLLELDLPSNTHTSSNSAPESYNDLVNMSKIPLYLEKFMVLGNLICFNSFLTLFTLVPLKIMIQLFKVVRSFIFRDSDHLKHLRWVKRDLMTISMIVLSLVLFSYTNLDISRMYHDIRGQAHIKLFVMFGVLEVADRLLTSLGQDILQILFELESNLIKSTIFYFLSFLYLSFHGYILIYQTVSLNVAANSYSNALLTLLVSNQFAELKGSVFKRFEREGLFQVTIADLVERYQLSLMVVIIATRNILQLNIDQFGLIPYSWNSWNKWVGAVLGPAIIVIGSEIVVDWLKHCYICKFNKFKPKVYQNFLHVLCLDYLHASKLTSNSSSDLQKSSDYISSMRRLGVPLLASAVCFLGMTFHELRQSLSFSASSNWQSLGFNTLLVVSIFLTLTFLRLILGITILRLANGIKTNYEMERAWMKRKVERTKSDKSKNPSFYTNNRGRRFSALAGTLTLDLPSLNLELGSKSYASSIIDSFYLPGIPNPEQSTINQNTRSYLYDVGEKIKPDAEELRNKKLRESPNDENEEDPMNKVMRYEMSSKRIW